MRSQPIITRGTLVANENKRQYTGKVLLVEDNAINQRVARRFLERLGCEVHVVGDGLQSVERFQREAFDFILMDMQMPVMGGAEATQKIRSLGIRTPIVAFTANVMKHQIEEYARQGFAGVVEKPIIREKLFATLKRLAQPKAALPARVLVVEDNEVNQMILFRYITKANEKAEVSLAGNGEIALELVKKEKFDLIFMDMEMPVMDGLTATRRIRALGNDTPLYIVSGNVGREDRDRCLEAGATGHIGKPLDKDQIHHLVQSVSA